MMNSKTPMLHACVAFAAFAMFAACHRDPQQVPQPKVAPTVRAPVATQRGPTPGELTAGMVEAASQGKSQTAVSLKFDLLQRPTVGQPLEIAIALLPQIHASPASIAVSSGGGLQLAPGDEQIEIPTVEPAQVYRHSIKVTPTEEGLQFLSLSVSLKHDEMTDSRGFSVPVIVSAGPANAANATNAAPSTSNAPAPRQ
jgi:hypothetical protein